MNVLLICEGEWDRDLLEKALNKTGYENILYRQDIPEELDLTDIALVLVQQISLEAMPREQQLVALAQQVMQQNATLIIRCEQATHLAESGRFPPRTRFIGSSPLVGRHFAGTDELPQRLRI